MGIHRHFYLFLALGTLTLSNAEYPPPCDSQIYCHGPLLHTIQLSGLFQDSKTFVDMKLKLHPSIILRNFDTLMLSTHQSPSKEALLSFIHSNFDPEGSEFSRYDPTDWHPSPQFLRNVNCSHYKEWAEELHSFWKVLGRKIKEEVRQKPELYSMIYTSHPVIVPGGRFREFFYWDSYWIMKGLLLSEMDKMVKGMLDNFLEMVDLLGYVPNGGRIYFRRSQPPFLIPMVKLYIDKTHDLDFLRKNLPTLEKEFYFWVNNRSLTVQQGGRGYRVVRYNVEYTGPRPESYREDYELAQKLKTPEERDELYLNLKSGAESGWDFSSRWFVAPRGAEGTLIHTKVRQIIPVELNALIQLNARILADFNRMVSNPAKATRFDALSSEFQTMINSLLWEPDLGCWFDYDTQSKTLRKQFYPTNIAPLWTGAHESPQVVDKVLKYLRSSGALKYPGGVPTSLVHAGEQWDFPNGWAPLQHMVVDALDRSGNVEAKALAFEIADKWITSNYRAFVQSKKMFEKYDVTVVGLPGGGGEYDVVVGFGWTNGVVLDFLNRYGDRLRAPKESKVTANIAWRLGNVGNSLLSVTVLVAIRNMGAMMIG